MFIRHTTNLKRVAEKLLVFTITCDYSTMGTTNLVSISKGMTSGYNLASTIMIIEALIQEAKNINDYYSNRFIAYTEWKEAVNIAEELLEKSHRITLKAVRKRALCLMHEAYQIKFESTGIAIRYDDTTANNKLIDAKEIIEEQYLIRLCRLLIPLKTQIKRTMGNPDDLIDADLPPCCRYSLPDYTKSLDTYSEDELRSHFENWYASLDPKHHSRILHLTNMALETVVHLTPFKVWVSVFTLLVNVIISENFAKILEKEENRENLQSTDLISYIDTNENFKYLRRGSTGDISESSYTNDGGELRLMNLLKGKLLTIEKINEICLKETLFCTVLYYNYNNSSVDNGNIATLKWMVDNSSTCRSKTIIENLTWPTTSLWWNELLFQVKGPITQQSSAFVLMAAIIKSFTSTDSKGLYMKYFSN